ncbi:hypothetical protein GCM10008018_17650 [Paenibacillus marchantiophytorum]|uniref:Extracellular solute-binding protein n=1 Tax=Paenibacillus marchantiophytorum TaxID=1619310 RepID=A0ABQ2BU99_9BACL|nr:extracellular solute-binding protein [Paenibacillus marchantiophytorum]GGI46549.1 hypothetical protein GCM10008018_17650 [Paenibacillus marchantiophytorum]
MKKMVCEKGLIGLLLLIVSVVMIAVLGNKHALENMPSVKQQHKSAIAVAEAGNPFKEHMEISLAIWDIGPAFQKADQDNLLKHLENKFNVTIKPIQLSWVDWQEKIKIWAATGELPDIFATSLPDTDFLLYDSWVQQGTLRALPEDMSRFPNLSAYLTSPEVQPLKKNGKFYAYPRYTYPSDDGWLTDKAILVRKDWMQKLGLHDPQNFEEFKAMLKAFVTQDPNGNGKRDEIGLEGQGSMSNYLNFVFSPTLPQYVNYYYLFENGRWIPNYMSEKFPKVLQQWRELYQEGLLDKNFAIYKDREGTDLFIQGKAGALAYSVNIPHIKKMSDSWEHYNPGTKFADSVKMLPIWPDEKGVRHHYVQGTFWSESYFSANVSDSKMERIMYLYDYLASEEGMRLMKFGLEEIDYHMENGQPVSLLSNREKLNRKYPSLDALSVLVSWAQEIDQLDIPINRRKFGEENFQLFLDSRKWILEHTEPVQFNPSIQTILHLQPPLSGISFDQAADDAAKVVLGKEDVAAAWRAKLNEYNRLGLAKQVDDVNREAQKQRIK